MQRICSLALLFTAVLGAVGCDVSDTEAPDLETEELAASLASQAGIDDYELVLYEVEPEDADPAENPAEDGLDLIDPSGAQELPPVGCSGAIWIGHSCRKCWVYVPTAGCTLTATDCGGGISYSGC